MLGKSKSEREYERERRAGQRVRRSNLVEQGLFAGFLVGVLILGVYLLLGDSQRSAIKQAAGIEEQQEEGSAKNTENQALTDKQNRQSGEALQGDQANGYKSGQPDQTGVQPEKDGDNDSGFRLSQVWPLSKISPEETSEPKEKPAREEVQPEPEPQKPEAPKQQPQQKPELDAKPAPAPAPEPEPEPRKDADIAPQPEVTEPAPQPRRDPAPAPAQIEVARGRFIYKLIEGRPTGEVNYIDYSNLNEGYLLFYTEARGTPGNEILHQWRHNGQVVANQRFTLTGDQQQLISRVYIPPDAYGTWRVYVQDRQGETLKIGSALYQSP